MTKTDDYINKNRFWQIIMKMNPFDVDYIYKKLKCIKDVYKKYNITQSIYNGKSIFSLVLPFYFNYHENETVCIYNGVLVYGSISKHVLWGGHESIVRYIHKEYSVKECAFFINNIQFLSNEWLSYHGFSIGLEDCVLSKDIRSQMKEIVNSSYTEYDYYINNIHNPDIKENRCVQVLNKSRDKCMKIAKDNIKDTNNFTSTVKSGSKGDFFNITQISSLVGQQYLSGMRIQPTLSYGLRTLPHYHYDLNTKEQCEQRGFITSSFFQGLNPREFILHAMTGREGITDTAVKTADSGYIQRRLGKRSEDKQIYYDNSIRDVDNRVIQFLYGNNGLDPKKTIIRNNEVHITNINRLADKINTIYETSI